MSTHGGQVLRGQGSVEATSRRCPRLEAPLLVLKCLPGARLTGPHAPSEKHHFGVFVLKLLVPGFLYVLQMSGDPREPVMGVMSASTHRIGIKSEKSFVFVSNPP